MDIDFGLAARRYPVKQHNVFRQELLADAVHGLLLDVVERMRRIGGDGIVVEAAHFLLVESQRAALDQQIQYSRCCVCFVEELLSCHLGYGFDGRGTLQTVPVAQGKINREQVVLSRRTVKLSVEHTQPLLAAKG